jgi:hypothetical protein
MSDIELTTHCQATRKDGTPCEGKPIGDTGCCFAHQPEAREWKAKGGRNRSNAARSYRSLPERLKPAAEMLSRAMDETRDGTMEPRVATALAALAGALVRVVQSGELEQRLIALEAMVSRPGA